MNSKYGSAIVAVMILLTLIVPSGIVAQDSSEDNGNAELEIVVTADRVQTTQIATPAHVTVITADEILTEGATNLVDVLEGIPGITFTSVGNTPQAQVDMRGFGEGSAGRVLVLVDGRPQNKPDLSGMNWLSIPVDSVERIEILRGSASALYGNHAVGGVINVITKTPDVPLEVTAGLQLGSFLTHQERLGARFSGDNGYIGSSVEHFTTAGYRDRSAYQSYNVAIDGGVSLGDHADFNVGTRYGEVRYELPGSLTEEEYTDDPTMATNLQDEAEETLFGADSEFRWKLADRVEVHLNGGYDYTAVKNDTPSLSSYTDRILHTLNASPATVIDWQIGGVPSRSRFGVDLYRAHQDGRAYTDATRETKTNDFVLGRWSVGGVFSNTTFVSEYVDLGGTIRYETNRTWAEKDEENLDEAKTHTAFVYDLDAVVRPTEWSKMFLSGGTVYRYPALDEQADVNFANRFENDLDPEYGYTVSVGGGVYLGDVVQVDANGYFLEMRDEIAYVLDPVTFAGANENIGKTRRRGGDLEISVQPIAMFDMDIGYSYVSATFSNGDDKGNRVPLVPDHTLDGTLTIRPIPVISFGPTMTYRSSAYQGGDTGNKQDQIDSYVLTDLFIRIRPESLTGSLSVVAEIENVFDITYAPLQYYSEFSDTTGFYPAAGRTFSVAASYRY